jgi:hypothetical protein
MRNVLLVRSMFLVSAAFLSASLSCAQDAATQSGASSAHQQKTRSKPHKVWTDDDLGSMRSRSRGDITVAAAQNPVMPKAEGDNPPAGPAKTSSTAGQPKGRAALSNPKTADEADNMIAWEQRDIDSQQEFVDRLQTEIEQAPPDQKERLQKSLAEHQKDLADTRQEQQGLIAQRKLLKKKSADQTSTASSQSPQ